MKKLNLVGTTRASFHIYNDEQDVLDLINAVKKVKEYFKVGA
jgi:cysteine desulfurase/selenocysteine lyase